MPADGMRFESNRSMIARSGPRSWPSVVDHGRLRDFFGFNRAKHAVIEAAILATRIQWLDAAHIRSEFERLAVLVEKTGGRQEHSAFAFLQQFMHEQLALDARTETASR